MASAQGYMYVARDEPGVMTGAAPGQIIRIASRAGPWLVVDHDLESAIVAKWPGRLWRVEILDRISEAEMEEAGSPLAREVSYTRAAAVRVIEELPVELLFGSRGRAVCAIIAVADALTLQQAHALAAARHPDASAAQTRAWMGWLQSQSPGDVPALRRPEHERDFDGIVLMTGRHGSPVGKGLCVIHQQVCRRAEAICGSDVWVPDEDDDEGVWLGEPWSGAADALLDAAHAFGAQTVAASDHDVLAKAWREVVGPDPSG